MDSFCVLQQGKRKCLYLSFVQEMETQSAAESILTFKLPSRCAPHSSFPYFIFFNCRLSVLRNTNESEWRVLTLSRFFRLCVPAEAENRSDFLIRVLFFHSLNNAQKSLCETQQSCLLFGWVIISFFFIFLFFSVLDQDGPSLQPWRKRRVGTSQRSVIHRVTFW